MHCARVSMAWCCSVSSPPVLEKLSGNVNDTSSSSELNLSLGQNLKIGLSFNARVQQQGFPKLTTDDVLLNYSQDVKHEIIDDIHVKSSNSGLLNKSCLLELKQGNGANVDELTSKYEDALSVLLQVSEIPSVLDIIGIINVNRQLRNLHHARKLHSYVSQFGLEQHGIIGNYLVPLFVMSGSVSDAQQVFNKLCHRNEYSWSALAQGYVECGEPQNALKLYVNDDAILSKFLLTALLKACGAIKCVESGKELHTEIVKQGDNVDIFLGNALVDMYSKCGFFKEAWQVFDALPEHDVVSWTALISGYVDYEHSEEALKCFNSMQMQGVPPNAVTYICCLKACGNILALISGYELHSQILKYGFESRLPVSNTLIDMYVKFSMVNEAKKVFDSFQDRDVVSWTALIRGYSEFGSATEALKSLERMQLEGILPNAVTYSCVLKACKEINAIDKAYLVHCRLVMEGFDMNLYVGTTLLDVYSEFGSLLDAKHVFEALPAHSTVTWNALITAYAESGMGEEALEYFEEMKLDGVQPDYVTFISSLKASGSTKCIEAGQLIHYELVIDGFENDAFVESMLVDMYAKFGQLDEAQDVFDQIANRDVVSWTAIIVGFVEWGMHDKAREYFDLMQSEGVSPNSFTYVPILKSCRDTAKGYELHDELIKHGLESDAFVCNALVDMYCKFNSLREAESLFEMSPNRDQVTWNILIGAYVDHGLGCHALKSIDLMQQQGIPFNAITYTCSLKACGIINNLDDGYKTHIHILEEEFESDLFVSNSLIDMYAKCGSLASARDVFDDLPTRDIVSWNALLSGYVDRGFNEQCMECFEQMKSETGILPNAVTYVSMLRACTNLRLLSMGYNLHTEIVLEGYEHDSYVATTLARMYASCGRFIEAEEVFRDLATQDVIAWTALIAGYADCRHGEEVLRCLQRMQDGGVSPNVVTFVCSLRACSEMGTKSKIEELESEIIKRGFDKEISAAYILVKTYIQQGLLAEARKYFDTLPVQDGGSWAATIAASLDGSYIGYIPPISSEQISHVYS